MSQPLRILLVSTPVGPLGSGLGGGVEWTARHLAVGLRDLGHTVEVIAPVGSVLDGFPVHGVAGTLQTPMQLLARDADLRLPPDSVLAAMWQRVAQMQGDFDVAFNLAYDALPFETASALIIPVAHLVSMGSLSDALDALIARAVQLRPHAVAVHSRAQAQTFGVIGAAFEIIGGGLDLAQYDFCASSGPALAFVARLAPEKGLEDALAIAAHAKRPLKVWGLMEDADYWHRACASQPQAQVSYQGFLPTAQLQAGLGSCRALLMTPKWEEAFGNVALEALACGVPVITYRRGGPAEIVVDGVTGFVVAPDDVNAAVAAEVQVGAIDRAACRQRVAQAYSVDVFAKRAEAWLRAVRQAGG